MTAKTRQIILAVLITVLGMLMVGATSAAASPGNGHGKATGRPADGTVGNADNKSPGGQSAGDHNHGYECDSNHGVGRGNPAHTGCTSTTTSTTQPRHGTTTPTTVKTETPTTVKTSTPTSVPANATLGETVSRPGPQTEVLGTTLTPARSNQLARTGADTRTLGLIAGALLAIGAGAVLSSRRRIG